MRKQHYYKTALATVFTLGLLAQGQFVSANQTLGNAPRSPTLSTSKASPTLTSALPTDTLDKDAIADYSKMDISGRNYVELETINGESNWSYRGVHSKFLFHGTAGNQVALAINTTSQIDITTANGKNIYHRDGISFGEYTTSTDVVTVLDLPETGVYTITYTTTVDMPERDMTSIYPVLKPGMDNTIHSTSKDVGDGGHTTLAKVAIDTRKAGYSLDAMFSGGDDRSSVDIYYERFMKDRKYADVGADDKTGSMPDTFILHDKPYNATIRNQTDSQFDLVSLSRFNDDGDRTKPVDIHLTPHAYTPKSGSGLANKLPFWNVFGRLKSLFADPVDTASGAFQDNRTLLSYSGANALQFDLNYNSIGRQPSMFGGGFTTNLEAYVKPSDDGVNVYWNNGSATAFDKQADGSFEAQDERQRSWTLVKTDKGYTATNVSGETYTFNDKGLVTKHTLANQSWTAYTYDDDKLTHVVNNHNQTFDLTYDYSDNLQSITDATGRTITFNFDSSKQLQSVTTDTDKTLDLEYDYHTNSLSKMTYDGHTLVENTYDNKGRVIKQISDRGTVTKFTYDDSQADTMSTTVDDGRSVKTVIHDLNGHMLSTTDNKGRQITSAYNSLGNETSSTDANGHKTLYTYDQYGNLLSQTTPAGKKTTFTYASDNQITSITTPDDKTAVFTYDNHALVTSTDKDGRTTNMMYGKDGQPTSIVKGDAKVTYQYDANGLVASVTKNGQTTSFVNDALGRPVQTTMPSGAKIATSYDLHGNVLSRTDPLGNKTTATYDDFGNVLTSTDATGAVTTNTYDDSGNLTSSKIGKTTTTYGYDAYNQLVSIKVNGKVAQTYAYDDAGNQTSQTNSAGQVTTATYDKAGQLISQTLDNATTTFAYDADDQLVSTTDGNGGVTSTAYDVMGRPVTVTDPLKRATTYTYDNQNNVTSMTVGGHTTAFTYNADNQLVKQTDALGHATTYAYNANNQLVKTTNALGEVTTNTYNALGLLATTKNNRGETLLTYGYNANGQVTSITDGNQHTQTLAYDANGRVISATDAMGHVVNKTTYTALSQIATKVNALNKQTAYAYADDNTTTTRTDANGVKSTTTTDLNGRVTGHQDSIAITKATYNAHNSVASQGLSTGENTTTYTYDGNQNVTSEQNADSKVTYTYDLADQITRWTNARQQATNYTYDALGHVTAVKSADTNNAYTYDANGNVLTADNANAKTAFKYDALNRVVAYTTNGQTTKYTYDDRGFMTKLTYPSGKAVTYDYDVMGNMLAVTDWNGHKTAYEYDKNNQVVSVDNWNKTRETRSYDVSGQVTSIVVKLGDKVIQNETYAYDANHNLIKQNNVNHTFDALNRLTSGYAYDKAGNITSGNGLTMTYDKDSRLQSINKVATTSDADGNLTAYTVAGKAHKATYNSQNQLTAYDGTTYTYDANGNRLTAGAQTFTTDATGQVLADKDNQYVYGAQGLIGYYDKTGKFVTVTSDNRGDILNLLDEAGTVRGTMSYSDYGAVTKTTGTVDTPFRYAGRLGVITDSNGLVYLKTRYYSPQLMRFMNRDTVAGSVTDSQSLNRFSYVEGNPLTYVDLNGQARTWLTDHVGFLGGLGWDALEFVPVLGNVMSAVDLIGDIASGSNALTIGMDLAGIFGGGELKGIGRVAEFASRFKPATFNRVGELAFDGISSDYKFARNADDPFKNRISAFATQDKSAGSSAGSFRNVDQATSLKSVKTPVAYGEQYIGRSKSTSKLKPNVSFIHPNGVYSETDELGRLSYVHLPDVKIINGKHAKRNGLAQRTAGWEDRLPGDNGGHMIAHTFGGSPDIDNMVAQNAWSNQHGDWRQLERDITKEVKNGSSVDYSININYEGNSFRPSSFDAKYVIDDIKTIQSNIKNEANY